MDHMVLALKMEWLLCEIELHTFKWINFFWNLIVFFLNYRRQIMPLVLVGWRTWREKRKTWYFLEGTYSLGHYANGVWGLRHRTSLSRLQQLWSHCSVAGPTLQPVSFIAGIGTLSRKELHCKYFRLCRHTVSAMIIQLCCAKATIDGITGVWLCSNKTLVMKKGAGWIYPQVVVYRTPLPWQIHFFVCQPPVCSVPAAY